MLIKALCDYYDLVLAGTDKIAPEGYSNVNIQYRVSLTPEGAVDGIEQWTVPRILRDKKGKEKEVQAPRRVQLFRRLETTTIDANVVEHRPVYLFGLEWDGKQKTFTQTPGSKKKFEALRQKNLAFLEGIDTPIVNAFRNYLNGWNPAAETENACLAGLGKGYATAGYVFCLSGQPGVMLQEDQALREHWAAIPPEADEEGDGERLLGQCAITGEEAEIASLHDKISGVQGGLATGTKLISSKYDSGWSYGRTKGLNSNISVAAMKKYTQALNYLLAGRSHKTLIGDMTVLHFAMSADNRGDALVCSSVFGSGYDAEDDGDTLNAEETADLLGTLLREVRKGAPQMARVLREKDIDPAVDYYMVGLRPNSSRLALQFLYHGHMGEILQNALQHQLDLATTADAKPVEMWQIAKQLVSPKATNQVVDASLTAKLMQAVITGGRYPGFLLATVVRRVRTDSNEENNPYIKLGPVRAGLLKACLNRDARARAQKEEIGMALDRENTNPAYLCGRLFAVLERVQEQANPGLNRTITDAYFASASARPAVIFPRLLKLSQTHLRKLEDAYAGYWNRVIGEICAKLNGEYPDVLSLPDQGRFDIGYYQQKYAPSEKKQTTQDTEGK